MKRHIVKICVFTLLSLNFYGCNKDSKAGKKTGSSDEIKQENTSKSLTALLQSIKTAQKEGKLEKAGALTRLFLPDKERLAKAFRPNVSQTDLGKVHKMISRFSAADNKLLSRLFRSKPEQTEIQVHCATTEEIAANKPGTIVFKEFPGAAVTMAKTMLKPKLTFCEVEFLEPGNKRGMKYHLFYWDGSRWAMLGPVWRVLKR